MVDYLSRLGLDEREIASRRAFFEITDEDLHRLALLRPLAERQAEAIIGGLYELLMSHPETRSFFPDDASLARVKEWQRRYFLGLFAGRCDREYVEDRLRVGAAHERVGLMMKWYIGAYGRYLRLLLDQFIGALAPLEASAAFRSLIKLVTFDMTLAIDVYIAAHLDTVGRQQTAIRELSTPVVRIQGRALLLPLVGMVDARRAPQILEVVLAEVVDEHARVLVIDISGVAVVDAEVATHLLKTAAAVRLLGAETIISGLGPGIARTMIRLGVDLSQIHTCPQMEDALELCLRILGKEITARPTEAAIG